MATKSKTTKAAQKAKLREFLAVPEIGDNLITEITQIITRKPVRSTDVNLVELSICINLYEAYMRLTKGGLLITKWTKENPNFDNGTGENVYHIDTKLIADIEAKMGSKMSFLEVVELYNDWSKRFLELAYLNANHLHKSPAVAKHIFQIALMVGTLHESILTSGHDAEAIVASINAWYNAMPEKDRWSF